jgi:hypothetical protein
LRNETMVWHIVGVDSDAVEGGRDSYADFGQSGD